MQSVGEEELQHLWHMNINPRDIGKLGWGLGCYTYTSIMLKLHLHICSGFEMYSEIHIKYTLIVSEHVLDSYGLYCLHKTSTLDIIKIDHMIFPTLFRACVYIYII